MEGNDKKDELMDNIRNLIRRRRRKGESIYQDGSGNLGDMPKGKDLKRKSSSEKLATKPLLMPA
jgi:hypothetical protein